jgi:hypothetical protein
MERNLRRSIEMDLSELKNAIPEDMPHGIAESLRMAIMAIEGSEDAHLREAMENVILAQIKMWSIIGQAAREASMAYARGGR